MHKITYTCVAFLENEKIVAKYETDEAPPKLGDLIQPKYLSDGEKFEIREINCREVSGEFVLLLLVKPTAS